MAIRIRALGISLALVFTLSLCGQQQTLYARFAKAWRNLSGKLVAVRADRPEWHSGIADMFQADVESWASDNTVQLRMRAIENTIKEALVQKGKGGVLIEVKAFDKAEQILLPQVQIMGYGLSPEEALNSFVSEDQLYTSPPEGSLFNPAKSYYKWATLKANGAVLYEDFLPGYLTSGTGSSIRNLATEAALQRVNLIEIKKQVEDAAARRTAARQQSVGAGTGATGQQNTGKREGGNPMAGMPHGGGNGGGGNGGGGNGGGGNGGGGNGGGGNGGGGNNGGLQGKGHGREITFPPDHITGHPHMLIGSTSPSEALPPSPQLLAAVKTNSMDWGIPGSRAWVDINGDGIADFCRLTGHAVKKITCTLASGATIDHLYDGPTFEKAIESKSRSFAWIDADGDGTVDFCRIIPINDHATKGSPRCIMISRPKQAFTEEGQRPPTTVVIGLSTRVFWVDVNADGKTDLCMIPSRGKLAVISCYIGDGKGFSATPISSAPFTKRKARNKWAWIDVNADHRADFCTLAGPGDRFLDCLISDGKQFKGPYRDLVRHY
jgi:hypothetical protein